MYRHQLGSVAQPTVAHYAEDFLGYVGNDKICTTAQVTQNLLRIAADLFGRIARRVRESIKELQEQDRDTASAIHDVVASRSDALRSAREPASMQDLDANALIGEHESGINELIDHCFHDLEINDSIRQSLHGILAASIKSNQRSSGYSGLVFAGFGEDEMFPSLVEVVTDGAIGNTIKAYRKNCVDLARIGTQASINAFAQHEMVGRFMNGVDTDFVHYLTDYLSPDFSVRRGKARFPGGCEPHPATVVPAGSGQSGSWR